MLEARAGAGATNITEAKTLAQATAQATATHLNRSRDITGALLNHRGGEFSRPRAQGPSKWEHFRSI